MLRLAADMRTSAGIWRTNLIDKNCQERLIVAVVGVVVAVAVAWLLARCCLVALLFVSTRLTRDGCALAAFRLVNSNLR